MYFDPQPMKPTNGGMMNVADAGVSGTSLVFTRRTTRTGSLLIRS